LFKESFYLRIYLLIVFIDHQNLVHKFKSKLVSKIDSLQYQWTQDGVTEYFLGRSAVFHHNFQFVVVLIMYVCVGFFEEAIV
jgi:hypothetical protein